MRTQTLLLHLPLTQIQIWVSNRDPDACEMHFFMRHLIHANYITSHHINLTSWMLAFFIPFLIPFVATRLHKYPNHPVCYPFVAMETLTSTKFMYSTPTHFLIWLEFTAKTDQICDLLLWVLEIPEGNRVRAFPGRIWSVGQLLRDKKTEL